MGISLSLRITVLTDDWIFPKPFKDNWIDYSPENALLLISAESPEILAVAEVFNFGL